MSNREPNIVLPLDQRQHPINRAMGAPLPTPAGFKLGDAVNYVDIFDLLSLETRVFTGLSVLNPSSASRIIIGIGSPFNTHRNIVVNPQQFFTLDQLTFGAGILSDTTDERQSHVRAILDVAQGTPAVATIGYGGSGNPTDQMTVEIGGNTYEFSADASKDPVNSDFIVAIGATDDDSWTNLVNKILLVEQAVVPSIDTGADVVTITSKYGGDYGDGFQVADGTSPTGAVFSGNTAGGTGGIEPIFHVW